eukprot:6199356-Pleurochrysis_carterae.AAC.2
MKGVLAGRRGGRYAETRAEGRNQRKKRSRHIRERATKKTQRPISLGEKQKAEHDSTPAAIRNCMSSATLPAAEDTLGHAVLP